MLNCLKLRSVLRGNSSGNVGLGSGEGFGVVALLKAKEGSEKRGFRAREDTCRGGRKRPPFCPPAEAEGGKIRGGCRSGGSG